MTIRNQPSRSRGIDRFESMQLLLKVVETGSLSAASRDLDIPIATVSRHLSELEAQLGARLLVRSSRRTMLTEAGEAYVASIRGILDLLRQAEQAAAGAYSEAKGAIYMTAPVVMGRTHIGPLIAEFLQMHPEVDVRLQLSDKVIPLVDKQLDLAIRIGHLPDSTLIASEVGSVRRVTCASPRYLARRGMPRVPDDLAVHDCVTFDNLATPEAWRFMEGGTTRSVPVRSRLVVSAAEAALDAAEAGLGITRLLSYQVGDAVRRGGLEIVLERYELPAWPVHVVYQGLQRMPRRLAAFLEFVTPRLRARLSEEASSFDRRVV